MMSEIIQLIVYSFLAGFAIFVGGFIASIEKFPEGEIKDDVLRGIIAFGGGLLVAAIALVLVPPGLHKLNTFAILSTFLLGAGVFSMVDKHLSQKGGSRAQMLAMMMDFIPEAIALGALFAKEHKLAILLAFFIAAQNLPEGFNAYKECCRINIKKAKIFTTMVVLSLAGIPAVFLGKTLLEGHPKIVAAVMMFAAGGILYLVFQDIAPQSSKKKHWIPALWACLGFMVGMLGQRLIG
ncbi:MAG: divalent cation transporter [Candidatus Aceula meridiana]|nr:divalent cation transporter [Candidatus Aceula meridiana]